MKKLVMKFAASTAIVSTTMVGCQASFSGLAAGSAWAASTKPDRQAAKFNEQARRSLREGDLAAAMNEIERAVALSPRDAGYRLLLADIYLKSGRLDSARTTYADVLEIDETNTRAGMTYALLQIALGRPAAAVAQLDGLESRAAPADRGLGYALAGYPERGIEILEPLARSLGATPRIRQNLALAYALAGDWKRARIVAAQDVSPADLASRMEQWASLAQPRHSWDQVANLLGVTPVEDAGQPVRLALRKPASSPAQTDVRLAMPQQPVNPAGADDAEVQLAAMPQQIEAGPIRFAEAASLPFLPAKSTLPADPERKMAVAAEPLPERAATANIVPDRVQIHYVSAASALVAPEPTVIRASASDVAQPPRLFERAPVEPRASSRQFRAARTDRGGRYVVQLGAFSNAENAERAWVQAERRFGLRSEQPLTTTVELDGRVLHRVSVAFGDRGEANGLCGSIKTRGGECFVREIAGDAPIRWAARYTRNA